MVSYNPSDITVIVPYLNMTATPGAASLGDNIDLVGSTGESNICVSVYYTFNGSALTSLNPGATCPYTTDSSGQISLQVSASKEGTYEFYLESGGNYSNGSSVIVNAPTVQLSTQSSTLKVNSSFPLEARVLDASGNGIPGVAVTFVDKTTGAIPNGNTGNPITTDSNGIANFSINLGCSTCFLGISCSYTWYAFIIVGANDISISSNDVTLTTSC